MEFEKLIDKAYLLLKSYAYRENLNLFLKSKLASFEKDSLKESLTALNEVLNDENWRKNKTFLGWLNNVDYRVLPKSIDLDESCDNKNNGLFITNIRESKNYKVSKINYFIDAPIELHVCEMLWCLLVSEALESELIDECYGNRVNESVLSFDFEQDKDTSNDLFKIYIDQYNRWRDQAIDIATSISEQGDDVALLSLDLKSYFYNIDLDFEQLKNQIGGYYANDESKLGLATLLTEILEAIFIKYQKKIKPRLKLSHSKCQEKSGLPIGFASSSIIANWYLSNFDHAVKNKVCHSYYGRYVDDIIIVFKDPKIDQCDTIENLINKFFNKLIVKSEDENNYNIPVLDNSLPIQKDKLILQFFDKNHSRAGLEVFKQELDERSSAFKFLPSDHINKELDKFAYDILYVGSANKWRSIVGLSENETGLAKYLSSHITAHRLCKLNKNDVVLPELERFFKGQNALQFSRLWEKIYQYTLITNQYSFTKYFFQYLNSETQKITFSTENDQKHEEMTTKLHDNMKEYNEISLAMSIGLLDIKPIWKQSVFALIDSVESQNEIFQSSKPVLEGLIRYNSKLHQMSLSFRQSNLIRHHLVSWPLANYSSYSGDLTDEMNLISQSDLKLDENKLRLSPRFIHYDEFQLFQLTSYLEPDKNLNDWFENSKSEYQDKTFVSDLPIYNKKPETDGAIIKTEYSIGSPEKRKQLKIAVANLILEEVDIENAMRKDKTPNIGFKRQENLYQILNASTNEKADVLIMPEVAIPVSWLPFMVSFARRNQIGIVFGLEHWVINDVVYNLIIEVLPFKISEKYKSCAVIARIKNHYAPAELSLIDTLRLKPGNEFIKHNAFYHKVSWRGVSFSTYNCFELSDISHRVLFKSEIDLLIACVWNKDTNYYQHILESTVRDLHCYTVQSNTSQYGGSCVLRPTKTENKTMLYVKGGSNASVLTTEIDIAKLRDFQFKSKPEARDFFKHLPPGFDSEQVLKR